MTEGPARARATTASVHYAYVFETFPASLRLELDALASRYGDPLVRVADLDGGLFDPLHRADGRVGEVCFVIQRPSGAFLTATKSTYPAGAYRLPTGGIHPGEGIEAALRREVREETSLDTGVRRFLAAIAYRRARADAFATFAFLLKETGGTLANSDPDEHHDAFGETDLAGLDAIASRLERMPDGYDERLQGSWRDWGRFRAVVHRVVREALSGTRRA